MKTQEYNLTSFALYWEKEKLAELLQGNGAEEFTQKLALIPTDTLVKCICDEKILADLKHAWTKAKLTNPIKWVPSLKGSKIRFHAQEKKLFLEKRSPKTRVLIVDDSKTIRDLLQSILSKDPEIEVVATATGPKEALPFLESGKVDVITLDIHMPEMDGVSFLKSFLPRFPLPTVMISSISLEEGPMVFQALEAGAVDYIQKPSFHELKELAPQICEKVKSAREAKVIRATQSSRRRNSSAPVAVQKSLITIGSSTGGTEALKRILVELPKDIPPILIVQHIPPVFSKAFANRMNSLCPFEVKEAEDGDEVKSSRVLVAPGGKHMRLECKGEQWRVRLSEELPVNRHRPSVDVLFDSVTQALKEEKVSHCVAAILTGMGADGARGLVRLKEAGARTIAQDEASCVVFGMPKEAIRLGAAETISALHDIPQQILEKLQRKRAA